MMGIVRLAIRAAAVLALIAGFAGSQDVAAQTVRDVPITAFFGKWIGSGVSQTDDSIAFQYSQRDINVTIAQATGDSFTVTWTTVQRQRGDPSQPTATRRETTTTFVASGRPNLWRATGATDPVAGNAYSWARIKGQTLIVHALQVLADNSYELQTYERTLTGSGMQLEFSRVVDGDVRRTVRGHLTKFSN